MLAMTFILGVLFLIAVLVIIIEGQNVGELEAALTQSRDECAQLSYAVDDLNRRKQQDDEASARMLTALVPLVEKSDWTTGNYIGRIDYLRAGEAKRNDMVDEIRTALMRLPAIVDYTTAHGFELFKSAATEGLQKVMD